MSDVKWEKIEPIVDQALELPKRKWCSFVQKKCGEDRNLKTEVIALLQSILDSEGWLENLRSF